MSDNLQLQILKELRDGQKRIERILPTLTPDKEFQSVKSDVARAKTIFNVVFWIGGGLLTIVKGVPEIIEAGKHLFKSN
tara:strand:- start:567 stop:803 length:237 start_codon:yes stop_codon:yes gene_type:complete